MNPRYMNTHYIRAPDLCAKNKVDGYPQMNLYKDGEFVETFNQPRELDLLQAYLSEHAEPTVVPAPPATITEAVREEEVPVQAPVKQYNLEGTVTSLDDRTFQQAIDEGHVFIKFYAPWCVAPSSCYAL